MQRNKQERVEIINAIIKEIAGCGRRFFYNKETGACSHFKYDGKTLWFVDKYTGVAMAMRKGSGGMNRKQEGGFSDGGTLWGLVNDFKDFINGDDDTNSNHGYGGLFCPYWSYPDEDITAVREKARELGYLKPRKVL